MTVTDTRRRAALVIGAVMVAIGLAVIVRLAVVRESATPSPWLDAAFALFFIARGALNIQSARRIARREAFARAAAESREQGRGGHGDSAS